MTIKREDGTHYGVALAQKRGDSCFAGKTGWYWYDYTAEWAIDEKTVTGPFVTDESAAVAGEHRLNNASQPVHRAEKLERVWSVEELRTDQNLRAKADCRLFITFDQHGGESKHPHWATAEVLLVTSVGVSVLSDYHTLTAWQISTDDSSGDALFTIPWEHVRAVLTETQADTMMRMQEADDRLLANAR